MDKVLSARLPAELVDKIARQVHQLNFSRVLSALVHQVVWVRAEGRASFMVSNSTNYYLVLDHDWPHTSRPRHRQVHNL